jgi:hypothetical protein
MRDFPPLAALALAEQVEPVAWRTFDGKGGYEYRTYEENLCFSLLGGLPKTATWTAWRCMKGTTRAIDTRTGASEVYSLAPGKRSSFAPKPQTPCLSGGSSSMIASTSEPANGRTESTAPSSGTNRRAAVRASFSKRTQLLMSFGLIVGITPTSIAKRSPQRTLGFASSKLAGNGVE